jgi:hypothetical protein
MLVLFQVRFGRVSSGAEAPNCATFYFGAKAPRPSEQLPISGRQVSLARARVPLANHEICLRTLRGESLEARDCYSIPLESEARGSSASSGSPKVIGRISSSVENAALLPYFSSRR